MKAVLIAAGLALLVPGAALAQTADAPAAVAHYTLDTPIKNLIADPAAKAVLDKDLPGLSSDENLPKFEDRSLRAFQPMTGGQLTDAMLEQVATDLAAIGGDGAGSPPPADDDALTAEDNDMAPPGNSEAPVGR